MLHASAMGNSGSHVVVKEPQHFRVEGVFALGVRLKTFYTTDGLHSRTPTKSRDSVACLSVMLLRSEFRCPY